MWNKNGRQIQAWKRRYVSILKIIKSEPQTVVCDEDTWIFIIVTVNSLSHVKE